MSRARLLLLCGLAACSTSEVVLPDDTDPFDGDTGRGAPLPSFFLDVEPGVAEVDGRPLLPQRFGPFLAGSDFRLSLRAAVRVTGFVTGERLPPWLAAPLPTDPETVAADLVFRNAADGIAWPTRSDGDGFFGTTLVPGIYALAVIPDDPALPATDLPVQALVDVDLDVDLGLGVPVWGVVRDDEGVPVPGALVQATRASGDLTTSSTRTDAAGWYQLRVEPGTWQVVVAEPPGERRPTLRTEAVPVGPEGARVDVSWAPPQRARLELRVTHGGIPVRDTLVRLQAGALSGYGAGEATYTLETRTDSQGVVDVRVPSGVYRVEVVPGADARLGTVTLDEVIVAGEADLGVVQLSGFTPTSLLVLDPGGTPLAGATVWCTELAGQGRSWSAQSADDGEAPLALPASPLRCVIRPPGDRLDLAAARLEVAGPEDLGTVTLFPGREIQGTVAIDATDGPVPAAFAIVRVVAADGTPVGTALADETGRFRVRVDTRAIPSDP